MAFYPQGKLSRHQAGPAMRGSQEKEQTTPPFSHSTCWGCSPAAEAAEGGSCGYRWQKGGQPGPGSRVTNVLHREARWMPLPLAPWLLKETLAAFHILDRCRLPLSPAQPNDKSRLPGELAALTPALCSSLPPPPCWPHLMPRWGSGTSSSRRDRAWSWARMDSGRCLGLAFQNVLCLDFSLFAFLFLSGILLWVFTMPPSHWSCKSDKDWEVP